ncbi:MAG: methyltransferase [Bacteroidetes bacterium GWE2_41_25]|nr:MAG: methyltransferase [Bacteroidetes bacterium GWE2_41_25]OFY57342.1 MAG: methyltransferase [Bacteroidetes bacterium GWF2_41_9]HAM10559.1 methyltransferase [Bacteroidales bacterium]HCU18076.1 methyltransferase [Bacteroidales bacterium]
MKRFKEIYSVLFLLIAAAVFPLTLNSQDLKKNPDLDKRVEKFLAEQSGRWHDLNVPESDGKLLYDLVIKGNYKNALEIGTSTGYSGIYIAWALSKTGGKLITIEIDAERHKIAVENFKKAGLPEYIDARLADAHSLVKELKGPFDFVFSDADKGWLKNYFIDIDPKLIVGGCYATHNISRRNYLQSYLEYIESLSNYESTLNTQGAGMLISYKRAAK